MILMAKMLALALALANATGLMFTLVMILIYSTPFHLFTENKEGGVETYLFTHQNAKIQVQKN